MTTWKNDLHPLVVDMLQERGIASGEEAYTFLYPASWMLHSPFLMKNMDQAVALLQKALEEQWTVGIFADSDLDGVSALAVLVKLFEQFDVKPEMLYPLGREGYGLTNEAVQEFNKKGVKLLITVDSGIRDVEQIDLAKQHGMEVLITDHHQCGESLPDAVILNPHQPGETYPFRYLAGVGVAFKLAHGFLLANAPYLSTKYGFLASEPDGFTWSVLQGDRITARGGPHQSAVETLAELQDQDPQYYLQVDHDTEITDALDALPGANVKKGMLYQFISQFFAVTGAPGSLEGLARELGIKRPHWLDKHELSRMVLLASITHTNISNAKSTNPGANGLLKEMLPLVAMGTIADVVSLTGENRIMVSEGIKSFRELNAGTVAALTTDAIIDESSIAWKIAPQLNTPGRYGETGLLVDFLIGGRDSLKDEIRKLNAKRRNLLKEVMDTIGQGVEACARKGIEVNQASNCVSVKISDDSFPEGLTGLVAGRIAEMYSLSALVVVPVDRGFLKGSGRSYANLQLFSHVEKMAERFEKLGGHEMAFGFTIDASRMDQFLMDLDESLDAAEVPVGDQEAGITCKPVDFNDELVRSIEMLKPFGKDNEEPILSLEDIPVPRVQRFGAEKKHGKFRLYEMGNTEIIGWSMAEELQRCEKQGLRVNLLGKAQINRYNGREWPRFVIVDLQVDEM